MSENLNRPMGPLEVGDQAIIDALSRLPKADKIHQDVLRQETVITSVVQSRETTPGEPKDHWSVASLNTDCDGMPERVEVTLVTTSAKDINSTLRGGNLSTIEVRTEEDKPKAIDRAKLHDRRAEQSIKLLTAKRLSRAAGIIARIQS
ncbi:MAG: hypothetical protein EOO17_05435 [Chloroflexi bacterium]|nr:MAG: hypothetical protein EOO17_05435 [Chloroflexota bacterium]